jgi:tetratricopeptide (TPR) repeat protein
MLDRALEEMQKKESKIVDKLSFKEQMACILLKLGRFEEAEKTYRSLLFMNPDNYKYFIAVQKCLGLYSENGQYSTDDVDRLCELYSSLKEEYGWSSAVKVNHLKLFLFFLCSLMLNC